MSLLTAVTVNGWFSPAPAEMPVSVRLCCPASSKIGAGLAMGSNVGGALMGWKTKFTSASVPTPVRRQALGAAHQSVQMHRHAVLSTVHDGKIDRPALVQIGSCKKDRAASGRLSHAKALRRLEFESPLPQAIPQNAHLLGLAVGHDQSPNRYRCRTSTTSRSIGPEPADNVATAVKVPSPAPWPTVMVSDKKFATAKSK